MCKGGTGIVGGGPWDWDRRGTWERFTKGRERELFLFLFLQSSLALFLCWHVRSVCAKSLQKAHLFRYMWLAIAFCWHSLSSWSE